VISIQNVIHLCSAPLGVHWYFISIFFEKNRAFILIHRFDFVAVGGVFAGLAIVISLFSVALHYRYNIDQRLKSSIILLHFMVPVYALCSWLGLVWNHYSMYFNAFRGIYEAICIYSFFNFLIAYLGGEEHVVHLISEKEQRYHAAPFSWCMEHWPMGHQYFYKSKVGCMQYVVIMFLLSIIQFICHMIPSGQSETSGHTTYYYMEVFSCSMNHVLCLFCVMVLVVRVNGRGITRMDT
jgi:hypothetical protein